MIYVNVLLGAMLGVITTSDVNSKWFLVVAILFFIYIYNFDMEGFFGEED